MDTKIMTKIKSKIFIRGTISALTGLHIGGNSVGMAIGGADNVVVRNPLTNEPYIPGSSIRGKMRSLLERMRGLETENGEGGFSFYQEKANAGQLPSTTLGKLFGVSASETNKEPTRLIVRDAHLTTKSRYLLENAPNTDMPMTEVKTEVNIDRITSAAMPRQFERVPAGAEFEFEFILTLMEGDKDEDFITLIREGMELVQHDSLGGHGSRGYGSVRFLVKEACVRTSENYLQNKESEKLEVTLFDKFKD